MIESILSILSTVFKFAFGWISTSANKRKEYEKDLELAAKDRGEPAKLEKTIEAQLEDTNGH